MRQWLSYSMMTVLFIAFTFITIHPVFSGTRTDSTELSCDLSKDLEESEWEKAVNEESISLFCFEISKLQLQNSVSILKRAQTAFVIPFVYYDIQLMPPEHPIG